MALLLALLAALADTSDRSGGFQPRRIGLKKTIVPRSAELYDCAFSPDGRWLAIAGGDGRVRVFNAHTWKEEKAVTKHEQAAWCVAFSPDGKILAAGGLDNRLKLFDTATWRELRDLAGHGSYVYAVGFSPNGKLLASASADQTVRIWDVASGAELRSLGGHASYVDAVAFSPDGKTLATGGYDGVVKLWDTSTWAETKTLTGHTNAVLSLAWSRDGRALVSGGADATIKVWDPVAGGAARSLGPQAGGVGVVTFTPDGRFLAASAGREVKLIDARTWKDAALLNHHSSEVTGVAIPPGSRCVATVSRDMQLKIWADVPGGTAKLRPKGFFGVSVQTPDDGTEGCLVVQVLEGTAAEKAGMQVGDKITHVNGVAVKDHQEAIAAIGSHFEGDEVEFTVLRGGAEVKIKAKLGKRAPGQ